MPLLNIDWRVLQVDASGNAVGTSGNPIFVSAAASPGTTNVQGVQAAGATPITAQPVLIGGSDGTNLRNITTDPAGNLKAVGPTAAGAAITQAPVVIAGQFGGNVKLFGLDTNGGIQQGAQNAAGAASWNVQGAAATGAAVAGNPVLAGGTDGTNVQPLTTSNTAGAAALRVMIGQSGNGNTVNLSLSGDADAGATGLIVTPRQTLFNGSNWDRQRNNIDVTLLASASRTTTQTSADIVTYNLAGISVFLNMTIVGTGSVTLTINGKDPASGVYYNILTGAAVVSNVGNLYRVMPGIPAVANKDVNAYLPRVIQIVVTANNANPATYSVGYTLHNP